MRRSLHGMSDLTCPVSYSLTISTNEKKLSDYDASYKKQLIYTPFNRMMIKAGAAEKASRSPCAEFYRERSIPQGTMKSLPPYFLLDGIISKAFNINGKVPVSLQLNLNNLTNKEYQTVPYRPMPGFNLMGTVVISVGSRQSASRQSQALNIKH